MASMKKKLLSSRKPPTKLQLSLFIEAELDDIEQNHIGRDSLHVWQICCLARGLEIETEIIKSLPQQPDPVSLRNDETLDIMLDRKVFLIQKYKGLRCSTDAVVLSALSSFLLHSAHDDGDSCLLRRSLQKMGCSLPNTRQHVVELGAGPALASVALALSCPNTTVTALELQSDLVERASRSFTLNNLASRTNSVQVDVMDLKMVSSLPSAQIVMANPPFFIKSDEQTSRVPPSDREKCRGYHEEFGGLEGFVVAAECLLVEGGLALFIIPNEREKECVGYFRGCGMAVKCLCHMLHYPGAGVSRSIIIAQKSYDETALLEVLLTLHPTPEDNSVYDDLIQDWIDCLPQ